MADRASGCWYYWQQMERSNFDERGSRSHVRTYLDVRYRILSLRVTVSLLPLFCRSLLSGAGMIGVSTAVGGSGQTPAVSRLL